MSRFAIVNTLLAALLAPHLPAKLHADETTESDAERETSTELAAWIDARFAKLRREAEVDPPKVVGDATYLRRVYLDLIGTIPSVARTRDFLADDYPYKRGHLVEAILSGEDSPYTDRRTLDRSAAHLARVWRRVLVPGTGQQAARAVRLEPWLKEQILDRAGYDEIARAVVTATPAGRDGANPQQPAAAGPVLLQQILGNSPDALADAYTRVFLGVRIGCAKCHDHPFADWKQEDFWGMAAFFAGDSGRITSSESGLTYAAKFLDGDRPDLDGEAPAREVFADWLTDPQNVDFAATAVNRVWQQLLGRPLAGSVDDLDLVSKEERALVLDDLAAKFAASGYDLQWLVEGICKSRVYQQASAAADAGRSPVPGRTLKTLAPEQVFDAMEQALALPVADNEGSPRHNGQRARFVQRLEEAYAGAPDRFEGGIPQALMLMHGDVVADATGLKNSRTLRAVVEAPFLSRDEKVETLYLATFTRRPTRRESTRFVRYVGRQPTEQARRRAYGEIFWALLNSPEFVLSR